LDIDSTGAAYIAGQTQSPDFPVTSGALQTTMLASSYQGFVAKVDSSGNVVYATLIGGSANTSAGGVLVDAAGDAVVSGQTIGGIFPTTPGAPFVSTDVNTFFVLKLDSSGGKLLAAIRGIGGRIASDDQGSIYIAGLQYGGATAIPLTAGAFQSVYRLNVCDGTGQLAFGCFYQYVTKLNASLSQIIYSTYLTGSWGAAPAAISVDAQRNVLLAGTTNSPDYPTTSNAFEPVYIANAPSPPQVCLFGCIFPPPSSGYVTKLNATGTGLVYSTFFSGTQTDTIGFAAFTNGGIYLSGQAGSPDLPGFEGVPFQCMPQTFETRLSVDGSAVTATRIVPGSALAYDPATGTLLVWSGTDLIRFDPADPPTHIACIVDAADLRPVNSIAPGELLSIFGASFVNSASGPPLGTFPPSLAGVSITMNGIASPLLYVSPQQINIQAPYEIVSDEQVVMILTSSQTNASDSRTLPVISRNPTVFLDTVSSRASVGFNNCHLNGLSYRGGPLPLAFNSDGSRNTCSNPAPAGSVVRIFLAGLGVTVPAPVTGTVNTAPGTQLNLPITFVNGLAATVTSAIEAPRSISGVWQIDITIPANETGAIPVSLSVDSVPVRDTNLTIWMQ
jgi:uncharacterized protein (TIGR03437 family)